MAAIREFLLNKSDLEMIVSEEDLIKAFESETCSEYVNASHISEHNLEEKFHKNALQIIRTSTKENTGMDEFEEVIKQMFFHGEIKGNDEVIITNMRHKEALMDAEASLQMVMNSLENHMPEDFYSIDLMSAYGSLGTIIGEEVGEDLVNEIFSKFCMGK